MVDRRVGLDRAGDREAGQRLDRAVERRDDADRQRLRPRRTGEPIAATGAPTLQVVGRAERQRAQRQARRGRRAAARRRRTGRSRRSWPAPGCRRRSCTKTSSACRMSAPSPLVTTCALVAISPLPRDHEARAEARPPLLPSGRRQAGRDDRHDARRPRARRCARGSKPRLRSPASRGGPRPRRRRSCTVWSSVAAVVAAAASSRHAAAQAGQRPRGAFTAGSSSVNVVRPGTLSTREVARPSARPARARSPGRGPSPGRRRRCRTARRRARASPRRSPARSRCTGEAHAARCCAPRRRRRRCPAACASSALSMQDAHDLGDALRIAHGLDRPAGQPQLAGATRGLASAGANSAATVRPGRRGRSARGAARASRPPAARGPAGRSPACRRRVDLLAQLVAGRRARVSSSSSSSSSSSRKPPSEKIGVRSSCEAVAMKRLRAVSSSASWRCIVVERARELTELVAGARLGSARAKSPPGHRRGRAAPAA